MCEKYIFILVVVIVMPASSVYLFVSAGSIHCIPVNAFNDISNIKAPQPKIVIDEAKDTVVPKNDLYDPDQYLKIRHKNLLYTLNNPSLSDVESDSNDTPEGAEYISDVIDNYLAHSLYFPDYSIDIPDNLNDNFTQIRTFLAKVFSKTWTDTDKITVKRLTGGITNMLLQCTYTPTNEIVLMRAYGHGTNLIIDRHREFVLHLILNSMHLAPSVHARFKNGLIYGFLEGRSLEPEELRIPSLYPLIAQQLGNWHTKVDISIINLGAEKLREYTRATKRKLVDHKSNGTRKEKKLKKRSISNLWELIEDWINIVPVIPGLIESFQTNTGVKVDETNIRDYVTKEFQWVKETLQKSVDSPVVSSHCDLLSGNIIIPDESLVTAQLDELPEVSKNPIKFIDYEYMLPAPRAFDIANHLAEWQGFNCDRSAIPEPSTNNQTLVNWVKAYLNDPNASYELIEGLIHEIQCYYGLPGFYWGIWSAIQSELSNIDFDYASYAKSRLQEYWDWKKSFLLDST